MYSPSDRLVDRPLYDMTSPPFRLRLKTRNARDRRKIDRIVEYSTGRGRTLVYEERDMIEHGDRDAGRYSSISEFLDYF